MGWLLEGYCVWEKWGTEGLVLSGLDRERGIVTCSGQTTWRLEG